MWLALFGAAIVVTALYHARNVSATTATGFVGTTIDQGRFGEIDVFNHEILPDTSQDGHDGHERHHKNVWLSWQKTKGSSDVYVQSNVWAVGGSTGWHTHPGHSLIVITAGTVTVYEGDDPECKPTVYTQGMGFVDHGGDHVHITRQPPSLSSLFRQMQRVGLTLPPARGTARFDEDRLIRLHSEGSLDAHRAARPVPLKSL
jgi:hypothetical protein